MRSGLTLGVWTVTIASCLIAGWAIAGLPGVNSQPDAVVRSRAPDVTSTMLEPPDVEAPPTSTTAVSDPVAEDDQAAAAAPPPARPPEETVVRVANGTDVAGAAGRLTEVLAEAGYPTRPVVDGDPTEATIVWFLPGWEAEAAEVASRVGVEGAVPAPLPETPPVEPDGANVVVLAGPDLA